MRECEGCGKREFSNERLFKFCGRCKRVLYCSKECQRTDWQKHKRNCQECKDDVTTLPHCGLCGARKGPFTLTECCNRMVCDDEDSYRVMSYNRIHCSRNHRRYSVCSVHFTEGHRGRWQDCYECRMMSFAAYNQEQEGKVSYDYAAKAGNPPYLPFRFNFDEVAKKFNWSLLECPNCVKCNKKIDTILDSFVLCHTPVSQTSQRDPIKCMGCHEKGFSLCECPFLVVNNSMDKY